MHQCSCGGKVPQRQLKHSVCTRAWVLSRVWLFATPWTVARQAPLSVGFFSCMNTGVGGHFLLQGIFPSQEGLFTTAPPTCWQSYPCAEPGPHEVQCEQGNLCRACVERYAYSRSLKTLATDRYEEERHGKKESKPTTCAGVCKSTTKSTLAVLSTCPFWGDLPCPFTVNRVLPSVRGFPESREVGAPCLCPKSTWYWLS